VRSNSCKSKGDPRPDVSFGTGRCALRRIGRIRRRVICLPEIIDGRASSSRWRSAVSVDLPGAGYGSDQDWRRSSLAQHGRIGDRRALSAAAACAGRTVDRRRAEQKGLQRIARLPVIPTSHDYRGALQGHRDARSFVRKVAEKRIGCLAAICKPRTDRFTSR